MGETHSRETSYITSTHEPSTPVKASDKRHGAPLEMRLHDFKGRKDALRVASSFHARISRDQTTTDMCTHSGQLSVLLLSSGARCERASRTNHTGIRRPEISLFSCRLIMSFSVTTPQGPDIRLSLWYMFCYQSNCTFVRAEIIYSYLYQPDISKWTLSQLLRGSRFKSWESWYRV